MFFTRAGILPRLVDSTSKRCNYLFTLCPCRNNGLQHQNIRHGLFQPRAARNCSETHLYLEFGYDVVRSVAVRMAATHRVPLINTRALLANLALLEDEPSHDTEIRTLVLVTDFKRLLHTNSLSVIWRVVGCFYSTEMTAIVDVVSRVFAWGCRR